MIDFKSALRLIWKNAVLCGYSMVPPEESLGYVLAQDVISPLDMPPFDKSAMDGYALASASGKGNVFRVMGHLQAGQSFKGRLHKMECVKIMTGAPVPLSCDRVVMVENTVECGLEKVRVLKMPHKGENICFQGEDVKKKTKVVDRGTLISPQHIALMAAMGKAKYKVYQRPEIAVINTGSEIIQAGSRRGKNSIYNSNGPMHIALMKRDGFRTNFLGIVPDKAGILKKTMECGLKSDVLVISGGVSMGDYDLVPHCLRQLGVREIFHKVFVKPGKPLFFGRRGKTLVFGVPGNPVSNFLNYYLYIRPAIFKMSARNDAEVNFCQGVLASSFRRRRAGRMSFVPVTIDANKIIKPLDYHGSADIFAISRAQGFMAVDKGKIFINKGSRVPFITWSI